MDRPAKMDDPGAGVVGDSLLHFPDFALERQNFVVLRALVFFDLGRCARELFFREALRSWRTRIRKKRDTLTSLYVTFSAKFEESFAEKERY